MSGKKLTRGLAWYAQIAALLPGTADDVAGRIGANPRDIGRVLRDLRRVGVAEVVGTRPGSYRGVVHYVIAMRSPMDAPKTDPRLALGRRRGAQRRMTPVTALAFRSLWLALGAGGGSVRELYAETGCALNSIRAALAELREGNLARIGMWERGSANSCWCPVWVAGGEPNAAKPKRMSRREVNARYWAARAAKLRQAQICSALAGRLSSCPT